MWSVTNTASMIPAVVDIINGADLGSCKDN